MADEAGGADPGAGNDQDGGGTDPAGFEPITSREQLQAVIAKATAKYADYDQLKQRLAEIDDADKTELQKAQDTAAKLQAENEALKLGQLRAQVAAAKGLAPELAGRLSGSTQAELEADADQLANLLGPRKTPVTDDLGKARDGQAGGDWLRDQLRTR